jgi:FkbM family methyltransferase
MKLIKDIANYLSLRLFDYKHPQTKIISSKFCHSVRGFYSQKGQDALIYSEFYELIESGCIPKVFLDIGCNHPIKFNNSYFFEKILGFRVLAVDPLPTYILQWAEIRPLAKLYSIALGASSGELKLSIPHNAPTDAKHAYDMFSTLDVNNPRLRKGEWRTIKVPVQSVQDILGASEITEVGIVSIDVEGFEFEVLKGFDFVKTKIYIAIIENNTRSVLGDERIREYMVANGFKFYARIWGLDDIFINNELLGRQQVVEVAP